MTRGQMRAMLRRRLQDVASQDFQDDAVLNEYINLGLQEVEKKVLAVDPDAFGEIATFDLVANVAYYPMPQGLWTLKELAVRYDQTSKYKPLDKRPYHELRERESVGTRGGAEQKFALFGRYFFLDPPPDISVSNGGQVAYVPTFVVELDNAAGDTVVPQLHLGLHMAAVLYAEKLATPEMGERTEAIDRELAPLINEIPQFYLPAVDMGELIPDIRKGY